MSDIALIAGGGALPLLLAQRLDGALICALEGYQPDGLAVDRPFRLERLVPFLHDLAQRGIKRVMFAGAIQRPKMEAGLFDPATAQMVPRILAAMQAGDDATLREVCAIFTEFGFEIVGVDHIAPDLLPAPGVLAGLPSAQDEADIARAAQIVAGLGALDLGQGAVVAGGLCLAVETLPGTDAMLDFVGRHHPCKGRGVLYKALKMGQSRLVDLPAIGVQTVIAAHQAGLAGIAIAAGGVIVLDLPAIRAQAAELGLFVVAHQG